MSKRSEADWQQLIKDYQQSGLSQTTFCRERKICSKSLKRHQTKPMEPQSTAAFVRVTPARQPKERGESVKILLGELVIFLPVSTPLQNAQLIKALQ